MISVTDARARILAPLSPTHREIVPLSEGNGRVLAAPLQARLNQPPHDLSAMDGFALRAADLGQSLRIIGEAPAGHPFTGSLQPGETIRLYTGSLIPDGADCVMLQEDAAITGDHVRFPTLPPNIQGIQGKHIRRQGQDFARGDTLIAAGTRLTPRAIGLAAAANHPWLTVHRQPIIAILATGDEISLPGTPIPPGGIISSNAHALAAFIRTQGAIPLILPIATDNRDAIAQAAASATHADLLLTTGGASVGAHDLVRDALADEGLVQNFWTIAMRPGKPLMFGQLGALPVLGLPGNPVSALVCALLFLGPAIQRLSGLPGDPPTTEPARCTIALPANDHRADHLRATLARGPDGIWQVTPYTTQDSAMMRRLTNADALLLRAPHAPASDARALVDIINLRHNGL
ncbi:MAG TPA: molybdopterin molybdotransferase MoeA [Acidiphilium sp.]|nr:MAG: molybdopterin molybdenumtransferase MoeA [Acidiphilium sp. 21-60-14]OZB38480.1 MAG: molybdopterin molybdenumtransferase MoeA [Acidiphilium sp. 34-60-192]HQT88261.1 molybdopterin molybdotransferase MoeA [Acidiphilium sp.]HQU24671.1 molybdopterin molybdotransferase MoeA [Acidiphilium sp.]